MPCGVDSRLADVLNLLDAHLFDEPFPARLLSRASGLTQGQLSRMCVRSLGKTMHAYWEHRRLMRAQALLQQPAARMKEIAVELGFRRLSRLSTWFKRHTGRSSRAFGRQDAQGR